MVYEGKFDKEKSKQMLIVCSYISCGWLNMAVYALVGGRLSF